MSCANHRSTIHKIDISKEDTLLVQLDALQAKEDKIIEIISNAQFPSECPLADNVKTNSTGIIHRPF